MLSFLEFVSEVINEEDVKPSLHNKQLLLDASIKNSKNGPVVLKYTINTDSSYPKALTKKFKSEEDKNKFIKTLSGDDYAIHEELDLFIDEDTNEHYYIELCEDTLLEKKIIVRINSKGQRYFKIICPPGRVAKTVNGRKICLVPSGIERMTKRLAIRKAVRTKKGKGAGYARRTNFKRQKAGRQRKKFGITGQIQVG